MTNKSLDGLTLKTCCRYQTWQSVLSTSKPQRHQQSFTKKALPCHPARSQTLIDITGLLTSISPIRPSRSFDSELTDGESVMWVLTSNNSNHVIQHNRLQIRSYLKSINIHFHQWHLSMKCYRIYYIFIRWWWWQQYYIQGTNCTMNKTTWNNLCLHKLQQECSPTHWHLWFLQHYIIL